MRGDGLSGVGSYPSEIQWDSQKVQKVLQIVLPPVKRNPALIPPDLRNKPPKVHVNYYPDTTTSTEAIPTPTRIYYTPPPRKINKITPPPRKITPQPPRKVTVTKDLILYPTPPPRKVTRPPRKTSYFPKFPEYFPDTKRPNTVDFARPSYNRRNDEQISLNTEYFIKKSDFFKTTTQKSTLAPSGGSQTTRRKRRLTTIKPSSRIPVLVKKIAKRPILKSGSDKKNQNEKTKNLCQGGVLECKTGKDKKDGSTNNNGTEKNYVVSSARCIFCDYEVMLPVSKCSTFHYFCMTQVSVSNLAMVLFRVLKDTKKMIPKTKYDLL